MCVENVSPSFVGRTDHQFNGADWPALPPYWPALPPYKIDITKSYKNVSYLRFFFFFDKILSQVKSRDRMQIFPTEKVALSYYMLLLRPHAASPHTHTKVVECLYAFVCLCVFQLQCQNPARYGMILISNLKKYNRR